jgi:hypothetical protein
VDAKTGEPTLVSYTTDPGATETGTGLIDMKIELPGKRPHDLRLSYVTEAPAWRVQKDIADDEQRVQTIREQMGEYRVRMDELHAQLVTLRARGRSW